MKTFKSLFVPALALVLAVSALTREPRNRRVVAESVRPVAAADAIGRIEERAEVEEICCPAPERMESPGTLIELLAQEAEPGRRCAVLRGLASAAQDPAVHDLLIQVAASDDELMVRAAALLALRGARVDGEGTIPLQRLLATAFLADVRPGGLHDAGVGRGVDGGLMAEALGAAPGVDPCDAARAILGGTGEGAPAFDGHACDPDEGS